MRTGATEEPEKCTPGSGDFAKILGKESAILPQNLFPITENYINNIYIDSNTHKPISIPKNIMAEVNKKPEKR